MSPRIRASAARTGDVFLSVLPVFFAALLLSSLLVKLLPDIAPGGLLTYHPIVDALLGAGIGSMASGHPVASYLLAGELQAAGASPIAATALIISWVTTGVIHLPGEALMLGLRFAVSRFLVCFVFALLGAGLVVTTLQFLI